MLVSSKADYQVAEYCETLHAEHIENKANKGQRLPENKQKAFNTLRAKVRKGNLVGIGASSNLKTDFNFTGVPCSNCFSSFESCAPVMEDVVDDLCITAQLS